jgi:hypothetical protein
MPYSVKHRERARGELEECREGYPQFAADVDTLVGRLADAAGRKSVSISIDLSAAIEGVLEAATSSDRGSWKHSAQKWRESSVINKARALLTTMKKRCPPWEIREFRAAIPFLGVRIWEVAIVYEISHGDEQIIVTKYDGLPGQVQ